MIRNLEVATVRFALDLLDEQAVIAEMQRLVHAKEWQQLVDLGNAHASAKQSKHQQDADAAILRERARLAEASFSVL